MSKKRKVNWNYVLIIMMMEGFGFAGIFFDSVPVSLFAIMLALILVTDVIERKWKGEQYV